MANRKMRCGILGGQESDLTLLSELHRQPDVEVAFVYEKAPHAVGLEIAEIIGVSAYDEAERLKSVDELDLLVVGEPRERFAVELAILEGVSAEILSPSAALTRFAAREAQAPPAGPPEAPYSIEETLVALERLLDRRELLKFLLEVAVKATFSSAGSVMLYSKEADELFIGYAIGLSERLIKNTRQKVGEGIAGAVALNKEPQLLRLPPDVSLYARDRERLDIGSAISVPLVWEGRLLGVLNVSSRRTEREHDESDLERLKALSRRLSRVLAESQKLEQLQLRHRETKVRSTMGEIAAKEVATQEKFSILAGYLGDLVGAETVEIFVNTHEGDWFVLGGSNRLLSGSQERFRYQRGTLSRAFLEKRCIVLTEGIPSSEDPLGTLSSAVFCYLPLAERGGVVTFEFSDRYRLDEFLLIREAVIEELGRFISFELKERRMRIELDARERLSEATASILKCRTVDELATIVSRMVADLTDSERVSVRLRRAPDAETVEAAFVESPPERDGVWRADDEQRFERLMDKPEAYTLAFLEFDSTMRDDTRGYRSLLALPVKDASGVWGGIIAYDKHPQDPFEDAIFSNLDEKIIENVGRLTVTALSAIASREPSADELRPESYESILEGNRQRFERICDSEISRSDRYHHSFGVVVFSINGLDEMIARHRTTAFALVEEVTQGVRTRTRKTDYGTWIGTDTYAMLSLEGSKRIRFLISRVILYLAKDLASAGIGRDAIRVGSTSYPGTARSAEELLQEALASLAAPEQ